MSLKPKGKTTQEPPATEVSHLPKNHRATWVQGGGFRASDSTGHPVSRRTRPHGTPELQDEPTFRVANRGRAPNRDHVAKHMSHGSRVTKPQNPPTSNQHHEVDGFWMDHLDYIYCPSRNHLKCIALPQRMTLKRSR